MNLAPLITLAFVTFALGFGELMIAGILPAIAADTHVSIPVAGQLVTVYALVFALVSPPLAIVLRRVPAQRVLIASILVVALANAVAFGSSAFSLLAVARIVAALGSAVATPLALAAVEHVASPEFRGRAHGIVFTGFSLAAMLGVPLGTLVAARYGWHATFGCVALLSAVAAVLVARGIPAGAAAEPLSWTTLVETIARPALRQILIVSGLFLTAIYTFFTYFRPYFEQVAGAGVGTITLLFFLYGAFGIVGTLAGGIIVDRSGARGALLLALGVCAIIIAAFPLLAPTFPGSVVGIIAFALTSWGFSPAANRGLTASAGTASDIAFALNLTAFNIGIALGSALGGITIAIAGIRDLPFAAAALIALAWWVALQRVDGGDQREIAR